MRLRGSCGGRSPITRLAVRGQAARAIAAPDHLGPTARPPRAVGWVRPAGRRAAGVAAGATERSVVAADERSQTDAAPQRTQVARDGAGVGCSPPRQGLAFEAPATLTEADPDGSELDPDVAQAVDELRPLFEAIDRQTARTMRRMLKAFQGARVAPYHWSGSSGYGRSDPGRSVLEQVYASMFEAEAACVRPQFQSGTHAIACALFGLLRPGQEMLAVSGAPYDTLEEVIGQRGGVASGGSGSALSDFGVGYRCLPLLPDGRMDLSAIVPNLRPNTRLCHIQRSCGYAMRPAIPLADIEAAVALIKEAAPECVVFVDNCYGEFAEEREPTAVGADLMAGSLIKSPGGTVAPCGGYIVGREELVDLAAARLSSPGVGFSAGATPGEWTRLMFQGFFLAPQMVGEARKGGYLTAQLLAREGFDVRPPTGDCVTAVALRSRDRLLRFCKALMSHSPVNSYVVPIGGATPGYESEVVFSDGTFVEGSTAELSADGPLREPYVAFCQGGTHWTHWAIALEGALGTMRETHHDEQ